MSEEVGALHYTLTIDDGKVTGQLQENAKKVEDFGNKVSNQGEKIANTMKVAGAAVAVAGVGITAYAKSATDFTVNLVKQSAQLGRQLGITTEEASRLTAAFRRMGIDAEQAQQMFGIFAKQIVASTENAGKNADAFSKLGVSTRDAAGHQKDFNDILFEVADKFKSMPNGVDKTALSMELFGRQGKDMIKVLNLGSDGIKDLEAQADKLGLTLNAKTIGNVSEFIKSQKDLKDSTDALKIAVGTATAPVLTDFNNKIAEIVNNLLKSDGAVKSATVSFLAFGGPVATGAGALASFAANIVTIAAAGMLATTAIIVGLVAAIILIGVAIYEAITHFQELGNIVNNLTDFFTHGWGLAIGIALAVFMPFIGIPLLIYSNFTGIMTFFVNLWQTVYGAFQWAISMIIVTGGNLINWFQALPSRILSFVGNLGNSLYNAGKDLIQGMINGVRAKIDDLINTVKSAGSRAISAAKGVLGIHSPSKVFEGIGRNVTEGFVKGINQTQGMALAAVNGLNSSIISPDLNLSASTIDGGGGNNYSRSTQNVFNIGQINNGQDENLVVRKFDRDTELEGLGMSPQA